MDRNKKIIISGGGTGGHIFPAIAIANELKLRNSSTEILFVGANGRMEMEKVPAAGYRIIGLPVKGFKRKFTLANLFVLFDAFRSLVKAGKIIREFKPDVVVGVGGYASGPMLRVAAGKNIPTLLQEQNSYAGVTNRLLAKKANIICVAYEGLEKYFPKEKIVITGNPVRKELKNKDIKKSEAGKYFNLSGKKQVLLIVGGSLGAGTINKCIIENLQTIRKEENIEIIWQSGKIYFEEASTKLINSGAKNIRLHDFVNRIDLAYSVADVIISRAGALSISELAIVGKPVILVPSPNVAEDHQTKNAMSLAEKGAAILIKDKDAGFTLIREALDLIHNEEKKASLSENIRKLALPDSTEHIVNEIYKLMN